MSTQLFAESIEVSYQVVYLVIKAINLGCIHDDAMKVVEVVVELLL